ncbi:NADH-quinone oxidoreductase subunit K [Nesterenkonia salmonea]|nr:NADH-quinone oxidoreductase subunit K [Nesterenkonia salmonea]
MDTITWYLLIATSMTVFGMVRLLLVRDMLARLIALDVTGIGVLVTLVALAARSESTDPVLQALVITGLVIAVAFTGLGAVLIRRIEGQHEDPPGGEQS